MAIRGLRTAGVLSLALVLLMLSRTPPASATSVVDSLMALLRRHVFTRYDGSIVPAHASLGDPDRFHQALRWATVTVDPDYCKSKNLQAEARPGNVTGATLRLASDPAKLPPETERTFTETAWHETMHLIEFRNGDPEGTEAWNERHPLYFEAMLGVLDRVHQLEADARAGRRSDEELRARWQMARNRFQEGAGDTNLVYAVPADLATFRSWSGCYVDFQGLEDAYRAGSGGERMQRIVAPAGLLSSCVLDTLLVHPQPRAPGASETLYETTAQFTLGAAPGVRWEGPVRWEARILPPGGKPLRLRRGEWPGQKPGYAAGDFQFALADADPLGDWTVLVTLSVQGLTSSKAATVTHTPAPTPAPSPSPAPLAVSIAAPAETAVGRVVDVTASVSGGVPPYRYEWTTSEGEALAKESLHGRFSSPGPRTLTLRAWDRGAHSASPVVAGATIQVHPRLEATIEGPTEVEPGQPIALTARAVGGKPALDYSWIPETGGAISGPTLTGRAGDAGTPPARVVLRVQDSLAPPQVVEIAHVVEVKARPEIVIQGLEVTPGAVAPGAAARVVVNFVPVGFSDPTVRVDVELWLEGSSGSGRGSSQTGTVQATTGEARRIGADFPIARDAHAGPIEARARVTIGGVSQTAATSGRIARAVDVSVATEAEFVGQYAYYDTTRPPQAYRAVAYLGPGGTGQANEWVNGSLHVCRCGRSPHPLAWSYREGIFTMDWRARGLCPTSGWFSGLVRGSTTEFVLTGQWSNGSRATVRWVRGR